MMFSRIVKTSLGVALLAPGTVLAANLLMYGPSVDTTYPTSEESVALEDGHTVTLVDGPGWAALTQTDFEAYDAIVFGDNHCEDTDDTDYSFALGNQAEWGPAVTGEITINTFDPTWHADNGDGPMADKELFISNSLNFASSGTGTGMYFSLGCSDETDGESMLSPFGAFVFDDSSFDQTRINDSSHPIVVGLTEQQLDNWSSSGHAVVTAWPASLGVVVANDENVIGAVMLATGARDLVDPNSIPVPSLSTWGLTIMALLFLALGVTFRRRLYPS